MITMSNELPAFAYHLDSIATGSVKPSDTECAVCGHRRGWIYVGPTYGEFDLDDRICPWCIADGSAHEEWGAEFTDAEGIGGHGDWPDVQRSVVEELPTERRDSEVGSRSAGSLIVVTRPCFWAPSGTKTCFHTARR